MSNSDELYAQLVEMIDGDGEWIRRAHRTGYLRGRDLLALILIALRDVDDPTRDPKKIIREYGPVLKDSVKRQAIIPLDPDTRRPLSGLLPKNIGGNWAISLRNINKFFAIWGWDWAISLKDINNFFATEMRGTVSQMVDQVFKSYEAKKQQPLNPDEDEEQRLTHHEQNKNQKDEIAELKAKNKELKRWLADAIEERDKASELFLGAIKIAYKNYDPTKRNEHLSAMKIALENVNVVRDEKTISKYLKIGYEENSRKPA